MRTQYFTFTHSYDSLLALRLFYSENWYYSFVWICAYIFHPWPLIKEVLLFVLKKLMLPFPSIQPQLLRDWILLFFLQTNLILLFGVQTFFLRNARLLLHLNIDLILLPGLYYFLIFNSGLFFYVKMCLILFSESSLAYLEIRNFSLLEEIPDHFPQATAWITQKNSTIIIFLYLKWRGS